MQIQKKEKRETNVSFRCEEVFTRQYLGTSTHIVIYNIQVLGGKTQKRRHRKVSTKKHLRLTFEDTARFSNKHTLRQSKE